eukprot:jgi/Undpi1/12263/HiC_scaffold_5.g01939.m1
MSTAAEILGRIEDDPVFRGFLEPGFDPAAFASKIVRADVGKAGGGAGAAALLQGEEKALSGATTGVALGGGDQRGVVVVSAESVSSQAEITLDVGTVERGSIVLVTIVPLA